MMYRRLRVEGPDVEELMLYDQIERPRENAEAYRSLPKEFTVGL
jgi:hypothetical protein